MKTRTKQFVKIITALVFGVWLLSVIKPLTPEQAAALKQERAAKVEVERQQAAKVEEQKRIQAERQQIAAIEQERVAKVEEQKRIQAEKVEAEKQAAIEQAAKVEAEKPPLTTGGYPACVTEEYHKLFQDAIIHKSFKTIDKIEKSGVCVILPPNLEYKVLDYGPFSGIAKIRVYINGNIVDVVTNIEAIWTTNEVEK